MNIIALSGKIGTGKTYLAGLLQRKTGGYLASFGNAIKRETAQIFGFDERLTRTHEGKASLVRIPCRAFHLFDRNEPPADNLSVRELLQFLGRRRLLADPNYWIKALASEIRQTKAQTVIIDDVRRESEAVFVRAHCGLLARLDPYPGWVAGEHAQDLSETALDAYPDFDLRLAPEYGTLEQVAAMIIQMHKARQILAA